MLNGKKILQLLIALLLFLFLATAHNAFAYTMGSSNFTVEGGNFDTGGGAASSANYLLYSMAGEDYLTVANSENFINNPGLALVPSPTPTTTPSSTTGTTDSTTTATAPTCSASKPGSAPVVSSAAAGANSVTLTWSKAGNPVTHYLIVYGASAGSPQYGNPNVGGANTTSYTVRGLSGGTTYFFRAKAINDCMPGDYSNEVSATVTGAAITEAPAEGFSQLFDIALFIDEPLIDDSHKLKARVTFFSFGAETTPVDMEFIVLDELGKELYRTSAKTTIQTEGIYNQVFENLAIPDGKYTLLLKTLYNVDVEDEFTAAFEVRTTCTSFICLACQYTWWLIPAEIIIVTLLLWRERKQRKEVKHV